MYTHTHLFRPLDSRRFLAARRMSHHPARGGLCMNIYVNKECVYIYIHISKYKYTYICAYICICTPVPFLRLQALFGGEKKIRITQLEACYI